MGYCKNSVLDFHKTLLLLPVEYYYHTSCEVSDISVKEQPRKNRLNIVFMQKMYNGENGIQKYVCTLLAHFTEITLHTLLKYFKCNCLHRWCFHTIYSDFPFVLLSAIMPLLSIYCKNTCILCHSFHQNDHFRMMGHATKLTFSKKKIFLQNSNLYTRQI